MLARNIHPTTHDTKRSVFSLPPSSPISFNSLLEGAAVYVYVCVCALGCSIMSDSVWSHGLQPARLLCPRNSPGKNTGVGFHFLPQGIFLTQELNACLLHWQVGSLPLSYQGSRRNCWSSSNHSNSDESLEMAHPTLLSGSVSRVSQ